MAVENPGDGDYRLRLNALAMPGDTTVADGGGSVEVGPGMASRILDWAVAGCSVTADSIYSGRQ